MPSKDLRTSVDEVLKRHEHVQRNASRRDLIRAVIDNREACVTAAGALATWTPAESTGRSPKDTYMVRAGETESKVDWTSANNLPIERQTFDMLVEDALAVHAKASRLYVTDRVVGADPAWALPVTTVSDLALTCLFTDNMFRPVPPDAKRSCFAGQDFKLLVCPFHKLDPKRYEGRLRKLPSGKTADLAVAMDYERRMGVIFGSAYCGSVKKTMFTVMDYLLPDVGVLPLHCSANEGTDGVTALMLGLSGTGKTTLSADPGRALLGDDEHGWSDAGVANMEWGCYAKLIHLNPKKEPDIYDAIQRRLDPLDHGAIVENAMLYPNGTFDLDDQRLTENSRGSFPLSFLKNVKSTATGGHPRTILFLAADANGVLPPVARLDPHQAMLWFMMGYTSKLAGTETGVTEPATTFSRFFGQPFMPRLPDVYAGMLGAKMKKHGTSVYLINTGWSGGPYGVGHRMDINLTRAMVRACVDGSLADVPCRADPVFKLSVPTRCPGVDDAAILDPKNTWRDAKSFDDRAKKLAHEFAANFDKSFGSKGLDKSVVAACPGK